MPKIPFNKPALTFAQQVELLRARGLVIANEAGAITYLKYFGYYRLSGYMLPYQTGGGGEDRHQFKNATDLDEIIDLYIFDRKLRLLHLDAIERIEIALRAALSSALSLQYGPHWYLNAVHFHADFDHADFMAKAKKEIGHDDPKRRDIFIEHYYTRYGSPETPPSWMLFEALSFGTVSMVMKWLEIANRKRIGSILNLPEPATRSWPHCLSYLRNLCAHHSRLWNRTFTIKPFVINQYAQDLSPNDRLYAQLVVAQVLMKRVSPDSHWPDRLASLLADHPKITIDRLAFPADWSERVVWQ